MSERHDEEEPRFVTVVEAVVRHPAFGWVMLGVGLAAAFGWAVCLALMGGLLITLGELQKSPRAL